MNSALVMYSVHHVGSSVPSGPFVDSRNGVLVMAFARESM